MLLVLLGGCATVPHPSPAIAAIELTAVPYFPNLSFDCGPAALATVLVDSGASTSPETLADQVYLPARHGSLQAELLAATRRHDRLAYVIDPDPAALQVQLRSGRPVLVLLNYGSLRHPHWHYAVVIGIEAQATHYLLRSGALPRERVVARRFLGLWERAGKWGVVVARPGDVPAGASAANYLGSATALEQSGHSEAAALAYAAAADHWPEEPLAWFALAGARLAQQRYGEAEQAYQQTLRQDPLYIPALNNLALLLARRGCAEAAQRLLASAQSAGNMRYREELADSAAEIQRLAREPTHDATPCPSP